MIEPQGHGSQVVPVRLVGIEPGPQPALPKSKWARSRSRAHFIAGAVNLWFTAPVTPFDRSASLRFPLGGRGAGSLLRYGEIAISPSRSDSRVAMRGEPSG